MASALALATALTFLVAPSPVEAVDSGAGGSGGGTSDTSSSNSSDDGSQPQEPFLCTTEYNGLGQPEVDNQDKQGTPVYPEDPSGQPDRSKDPIGWSKDCKAGQVIEYRYRDAEGETHTLDPDATVLPSDIAQLDVSSLVGADKMDLDGATTIPYLYRYVKGTLDDTRFIYSMAMLVPPSVLGGDTKSDDTITDHWNHRLVYSFGGGVGIGHSQGSLSGGDSQLDEALRLGDAVVYSSGTRTSVHYNLLLASRVANELKALFIKTYGDSVYTIGIGGSGGSIQQYVNAQNNPDLLDALIPQYSYPDMTTQTINVGDCELLEHYMDVTDSTNERWKNWDNRKILEGQNSIEGFTSDWQEATNATGSSECIEGWRGATPLALNPNFGLAADMDDVLLPFAGELMAKAAAGEPAIPDDFPDLGRMLRVTEDESQWVMWTHWDDAKEAYGVDPKTGLARVPWDNVGVQYGLRAVANGQITPDEFLDLNTKIGSWKSTADNVKESCGMVTQMTDETLGAFAKAVGICEGDELDQYSARQMNLATGDGIAPRTKGDVIAIENAFKSGLEFDGKVRSDIPILDMRHYLEDQLDMHNAHQSFNIRERIKRTMGNADNQIIWWLDARPEEDEAATKKMLDQALRLMDKWTLAVKNSKDAKATAVKPAEAVDSCWRTDGTLIASGDHVWDGAVELAVSGQGAWKDKAPSEVDGVKVGDCAKYFPINSTSRIIAGGPITNDVYKCHLKPVSDSVKDGDYGDWKPTEAQLARIEEIFPDGVCDYSKRSVGYPGDETASAGTDSDAAPGKSSDSGSSKMWMFIGGLAVVIFGAAGLYVLVGRAEDADDASGDDHSSTDGAAGPPEGD